MKISTILSKPIYLLMSMLLMVILLVSGYFLTRNYTLVTVDANQASQLGNKSQFQTHQDLGEISMQNGVTTLTYKLQNETDSPLDLTKMYTSCMCTKAKLVTHSKETVFAGMQGHTQGLMPIDPDITLQPGEEAQLEVEFDPNAHGPQGVGPMTRSVVIETDSTLKPQLQFTFAGIVTK